MVQRYSSALSRSIPFIVLTALAMCLQPAFTQAQKLSNSLQGSRLTRIYRLTETETFLFAAGRRNSSMLHTQVDSFDRAAVYRKELAPGHYLFVTARQAELAYRLHAVQNLDIFFVNQSRKLGFTLTDRQGRAVTDAVVRTGSGRVVRFDRARQLYVTGPSPGTKVIRAVHAGQTNFFVVERHQQNYRPAQTFRKFLFSKPLIYTWMPVKNLLSNRHSPISDAKRTGLRKFSGYMTFNKPKFKPGDTLRWKAFVVSRQGRSIRPQAAELVLKRYGKPEQILDTCSSTRPGSFSGTVALAALKLDLDRQYTLELRAAGGGAVMVSGTFGYEDYELKALRFAVRTDKTEHAPGNPIALYIKASDENDLAVPDGRVELIATSGPVRQYRSDGVFVPDTLWQHSIKLEPVGETRLLLPDSIFPRADLAFNLSFQFRNSSNESRSEYRSFSYTDAREQLTRKFEGDSIRFDYLLNGRPQPRSGMLYRLRPDETELDSLVVQLPYCTKFDPRFGAYELQAGPLRADVTVSDFDPQVAVSGLRHADSLYIKMSNPRGIRVWYMLSGGNKVLASGYGTRLDTAFQYRGSQPVAVQVNFRWGEAERSVRQTVHLNKNLLAVQLDAPAAVYPGQTVAMKVSVRDADKRPVTGADLTAQAYTGKFGSAGVFLPYFADRRDKEQKAHATFEGESLDMTMGRIPLDWQAFGKRLALDTVEYYRFLYPKGKYELSEASRDTTTSVVPFLVSNGAIDPVSIIYIDGVPVYFSQADQLQRYAFKVDPGRHRIILRSSRYEADFEADIRFGHRHVISVQADPKNASARVVAMGSKLSPADESVLSNYMFRVQDNFQFEKTVIRDGQANTWLLNPPGSDKSERLIGPIAANYLTFSRPSLTLSFLKEPDFSYTFAPGLIRQKSASIFDNPGWQLRAVPEAGNTDYRQQALDARTIDSIWNDFLDMRSRTTNLFPVHEPPVAKGGTLVLALDTSLTISQPYLKTIVLYRYDAPDFVRILPGNTQFFGRLAPGAYRVLLLLKDNRYYMAEQVSVKTGGSNYLKINKLRLHAANKMSMRIDSLLKSAGSGPGWGSAAQRQQLALSVTEQFNDSHLNRADFGFRMTGRVTSQEDGSAMPGVAVKVKGFSAGVSTGADGTFSIPVPAGGHLTFSFLGFENEEVPIKAGAHVQLSLKPQSMALQEVVVVGYGAAKRRNLTASVATVQGATPGLQIRGKNSAAGQPMLIVDGLPYNGRLEDISSDDIADVSILKDAAATAIYGSQAANGVVIIKRKAVGGIAATGFSAESGLRRNFSDVGFWKPELFTDANGEARFTVTFPDDITSWNTEVFAMTGRRQSGQIQTSIRSFKSLSANLVSPQFAIKGDSLQVMGKLMNYTPVTETVMRRLLVNGTERLAGQRQVKHAHLDSLMFNVTSTDTLQFRYTLDQPGGYTDGEERKVPVYDPGVLETEGKFAVLAADTSVAWNFDAARGSVKWYAEASVFPVLLDELRRVRDYPYQCNEQLASKLKALLLEKQLRKMLKQPFSFDSDIGKIIRLLEKNRLPNGLWSWWPDGRAEMWITIHVADALLKAGSQHYHTSLDKTTLFRSVQAGLSDLAAGERSHALELLHLLDPAYPLSDWLRREEQATRLVKQPGLYTRLRLLRLKQLQGEPIQAAALVAIKKQTMFGGSYWGEEGHAFFDNSVQNTLLVYKLLKTAGGHAAELARIRQYFLEQRKDGQWRNTYEAALILEAILPDLLEQPDAGKPSALRLNGTLLSRFPANGTLPGGQTLSFSKTGTLPVYITAYQQFLNPRPVAVKKDFEVKTVLLQQGAEAAQLKAGIPAVLRVEVKVRADADYVMIEVPVPASCSYDDKAVNYRLETHREYFKEKTAIFCNKLKQGSYIFEIRLMPRYQGRYVLNPARAEMMYFPVFYGREALKNVAIN
ncbi:hypothetical protein C7T94_18095 [Pedobacter yulinensis]|uniref:Alpha-2-macroglobulin domain-containing protein n=1 Tax=Pedobacter yulinensis TaxID=2126353 RepID=A0A2T3HH79_9SPHI|nr:alpha-2-macroglobulin family protein [Pedobacter yulinensis]PST81782.1 hypothetical protein C7T94_18095 [Pedobacter yulinensis]